MKIIILDGPANSGKTTTLKEVYAQIKRQGVKDIVAPKPCPASKSDDEYYVPFKGKNVAIVTVGDYALETIFYFGYYYGIGADVLVIANSQKGFPYTLLGWHDDIFECITIEKHSIQDNEDKIKEIIQNI